MNAFSQFTVPIEGVTLHYCPHLTHVHFTIDTTHEPVRATDKPLLHSSNPLYFHPHASLLSRSGNLHRMLEYTTEIYPNLALHLSDDYG